MNPQNPLSGRGAINVKPTMTMASIDEKVTTLRPRAVPESFQRNGYHYRLVERSGRVAIYAQYTGTRLLAYEVAIIRLQKALPFLHKSPQNDDLPQMRERYPSDEDWGCFGWTCSLYGGQVPAAVALAQARAIMKAKSNIAPSSRFRPLKSQIPRDKTASIEAAARLKQIHQLLAHAQKSVSSSSKTNEVMP